MASFLRAAAIGAVLAAVVGTGGCAPKQRDTVTMVAAPDSEEGRILTVLYLNRGTYGQALRGMQAYFLKKGQATDEKWARHELADLGHVPLYLYDYPRTPGGKLQQAAIGAGGQPFEIGSVSEVDLVENFAEHRNAYRKALEDLVDLYGRTGDARVKEAREELTLLRQVRPYAYLQRAYIPGKELKPTQSIAEADRLYEQALANLNKLRPIPAVGFWFKDSAEATARLGLSQARELIDTYPTSDKIAEAAYLMGYFSGEYLLDEEVAVVCYERAFQWDPKIQHPARFRAAILYDYRMHDRDRALELYNQAIKYELFNTSNGRWAATRIKQLTEGTGDAGQPPPPGD